MYHRALNLIFGVGLMLIGASPIYVESSGTALLLNGCSSAGKTTLAKQLAASLEGNFMHVSMDEMITTMPEGLNDFDAVLDHPVDGFQCIKTTDSQGHPTLKMCYGPAALALENKFKNDCVLRLQRGENLIIDEVIESKEQFAMWKEKLTPFRLLTVGLFAPLEEIEKREVKRGNRPLGEARGAYFTVHADKDYDLKLDTFNDSADVNTLKIKNALGRSTATSESPIAAIQ